MSKYIDAEKLDLVSYQGIPDGYKDSFDSGVLYAMNLIDEQPTVDAVPVWIPFKMRKPDADELEDHPDWTYVLDGQLPDEGQRILVCCVFRGHEAVQLDEFYTDADGCYLDSGYEIGTEVSAWMPLPEPYKMDEVTE